jgi:hypothetical protein
MLSFQKLHVFQERAFDIVFIILYLLMIASALGFSTDAQKYIEKIDYYIKIYVCLFLIWRFNPLRSHYEFTNLDAKIAFTAGIFVLTTTALNTYLTNLKDNASNKAKKFITKVTH